MKTIEILEYEILLYDDTCFGLMNILERSSTELTD